MAFQRIVLIILSFFIFSPMAYAFDGFGQSFGDDRAIAWGNGKIIVTEAVETSVENSTAPPSPLAVRKAASRARKILLDMIMSTRIDAKQTVSAYLSDNDDLAAQLRGLVHNSLFEGPDQFSDTPMVTVSASLRGKLAELVLPKTIQFQSGIPPRLSTAAGPAYASEEGPEAVGTTGGYTGIIVDARGLKVTPCLLPVVYGEDGLGAYGAFLVSRSDVMAVGVAAYATTVAPEALSGRVGSRPLVVKAERAYGSWRTDLVISAEEAALVRAIMQSGKARKCGVAIVLDEPPAPAMGDVQGGGSDA